MSETPGLEDAIQTILRFMRAEGAAAEVRKLIGGSVTTYPYRNDLAHQACLELERRGEIERWHEHYGGATDDDCIVWQVASKRSDNIVTGQADIRFGEET